MMMATAIEWTDETWNPVTGCVKISPGCKNCYAEAIEKRWGRSFSPAVHPNRIDKPRHWRKPRRVFVNSMSDLFGEFVPQSVLEQVFSTMRGCPQHSFQILTKRAERMAQWTPRLPWLAGARHIWLGVSVEDRKYGVPRIDHLRAANAAMRFLSVEPLLENLGELDLSGIDWVIIGGESGPHARPFDPEWAKSLIIQCRRAGVPCFMKQMGSNVRAEHAEHYGPCLACMHHPKGGEPLEWPIEFRVREFPAVA